MSYISELLCFLSTLSDKLKILIEQIGNWTYLITGFALFSETGLFLSAIVPGDSLLFLQGALSSMGIMNLFVTIVVMIVSVSAGDNLNYLYGKFLGPKVFKNPKSKIFNPKYVEKMHTFYEKYGRVTVVIARFIPIGRSFASLVAGMSKMNHKEFAIFNFIGCTLWVISFVLMGYFFGQIPVVKNNFSIIIIGFALVPIVSWIVGMLLHKKFHH